MTDKEYLDFLNSLDENLIIYENFKLKFIILEIYKKLNKIYEL